MDEATEQSQINQAIEACLISYFSKEVEQEISGRFGAEIARKVKAVYDDALNCPVNWKTATMDSAVAILADYLRTHYPWLTDQARSTLNYCYIMAWK